MRGDVEVVIACRPTRADEPYLEETLECFSGYDVRVDDAVEEHATGHPAGVKWNRAIDACRAKFLALPHSDDVYLPEFLPRMCRALEEQPSAVAAFCMDRFIDGNGRRVPGGSTLPIPQKDLFTFKDVINAILAHGNFLRCPTVVFRRELLGDMRFDVSGRFGTAVDMAFWALLLSRHPIVIVNEPLVRYRIHAGQDTQGQREKTTPADHWYAMEYALTLRPQDIDAKTHVAVHMMLWQNEQLKENQRAKAKATQGARATLVVVHEPPDNAGTGVVAAHRVREFNKTHDDKIAYYVYPVLDDSGNFRPFVEDGFLAGCPCIRCPPALFQSTVRRLNPERIEFHHTLLWGDDILRVDTGARKQLYLHDRWMWSVHPHQDGEFRDTKEHLKGIEVFGNSEWTCREARENLGVSVSLFDAFVPTVKPAVSFRKRVGYFGGWATVKGVDVLVKAAMQLPDVLFVLFSNVPSEDLLGRRMHGMDNVVVVGGYSRSDMHLLVHLVDCVAVPSRFESFGLVKKELESLGVPVVATRVGGQEGSIPPDDVSALVEALR